MSAGRDPEGPPGLGAGEVDDPLNAGVEVYHRTAERLDPLTAEPAALPAPPRPRR